MKMTISTYKTQQGAALVVCLIVLLVMTAIGVTSVSNSTIQQRMAFNLRQQQLAENAAEHALRAAENYISNTVVSTAGMSTFYNDPNRGTSFYMVADIPGTQFVEAAPVGDMTLTDFWVGANGIEVPGLSSDATSRPPQYIIEMVGKTKEGNRRLSRPSAADVQNFRYNFRITAIGWGVDPNAYSVLQSTYETIRITDF